MKNLGNSPSNFILSMFQMSIDYAKSNIDVIFDGISFIFLGVLGIRAITHLDTSWDSLAYHLPFAARLAGIFPKSEYIFDDYFESLYLGVPKLTELVQGLFWRTTGLVSSTNLVGLVVVVLVLFYASIRLKLNFWMTTLFILSIPLVTIHSVTSYNDLPSNGFIVIAFISFIAAVEHDQFDHKNLVATLLPLAISANLKYQTTLIAAFMFVLVCFVFFIRTYSRR